MRIACRRPHIRNVEILFAVVVGVEPGDTHSRADVFDAGFAARRRVNVPLPLLR